jgi:hypothetical protein
MCATPFSMYYVALGVSLGVGVLATLLHMWFVHRDARVTSHVLKYVMLPGGPWPEGCPMMDYCIALHCAGAC